MYNITTVCIQNVITLSSTSQLVLILLYYIALCPMMPRFIISVRELYDRDLRGRWQGIDTGFGVLSQPIFDELADTVPGQEQGREGEGEVDDSEAIRPDMCQM
jgi:hypothetical protein